MPVVTPVYEMEVSPKFLSSLDGPKLYEFMGGELDRVSMALSALGEAVSVDAQREHCHRILAATRNYLQALKLQQK